METCTSGSEGGRAQQCARPTRQRRAFGLVVSGSVTTHRTAPPVSRAAGERVRQRYRVRDLRLSAWPHMRPSVGNRPVEARTAIASLADIDAGVDGTVTRHERSARGKLRPRLPETTETAASRSNRTGAGARDCGRRLWCRGPQPNGVIPSMVSPKLPAACAAGRPARSTRAWPKMVGVNVSPNCSVNSATLIPATPACACAPAAPTAVSGVSLGRTEVTVIPSPRRSDRPELRRP